MKKTKSIFSMLVERMYAGEIIAEWARCISKGRGPEIFANLFLEVMRDPQDDQLRRDAVAFLVYVDTRSWTEILGQLTGIVDKGTLKVLRRPGAEKFYDTWKYMVRTQVADYWKNFVKAAKKTA